MSTAGGRGRATRSGRGGGTGLDAIPGVAGRLRGEAGRRRGRGVEEADGLDWMRLREVARRLRLTGVGAGMGCGGGREEG